MAEKISESALKYCVHRQYLWGSAGISTVAASCSWHKGSVNLPHTTLLIWQMLTYAHAQTKTHPYGKLSQWGWLQKTLSSILLKKCRKPGKPGWEEGPLPICMSKVEDHFYLGREGQASQSMVTAGRWDHRKSGASCSHWVTPALCLLPWRQETGACGKHPEKSMSLG